MSADEPRCFMEASHAHHPSLPSHDSLDHISTTRAVSIYYHMSLSPQTVGESTTSIISPLGTYEDNILPHLRHAHLITIKGQQLAAPDAKNEK